jgi:hypothetical protein
VNVSASRATSSTLLQLLHSLLKVITLNPASQAKVSDAILEAALEYAASGKPVFPCRPQDEPGVDYKTGEPRTFTAKSPYTSKGFKEASTFQNVLERWWSDWPGALIGMPTGERTGVWVLDVDPRHDGDATLAFAPLPADRTSISTMLTASPPARAI